MQHRSVWLGLMQRRSVWLGLNWPHCCDFGGDTCDGLRWSAMVLEASKPQQNAPFHHIVWPGLMKTCHRGSRLATLLRFLWRYMRWYAMVCDASRSSKSQENGPFHRIVTVRCCTPAMGRSKAPTIHQNCMRCAAMHFPTCFPTFLFPILEYLSHLLSE